MKRQSIVLIMALMSFALVGVMAMQFYFIRESYELKTQLFDQSVNEALKNVSEKLEKKEALLFLAHKADLAHKRNEELARKRRIAQSRKTNNQKLSPQESSTIAFVQKMKANQAKSDSIFRLRDSLIRSRYPYKLVYNGPVQAENQSPRFNLRVDVDEVIDEYGNVHTIQRQSLVETQPAQPQLRLVSRGNAVVDTVRRYVVQDPILGTVLKTIPKPNFLTGISERELKLASRQQQNEKQAKRLTNYLDSVERVKDKSSVFEDIASEMQQVNVPLRQRVEAQNIDSLLATELANNGVNLNYTYRIGSVQADSIIFSNASQKNNQFLPQNTYKTALFTKDMLRDGGYLMVSFPQKNSVILRNMGSILLSSVSLLLVLAGSFIYTISSILRQKKVSEMKTDFINNMTHEFKTPVATIMIASEALKDPEINSNTARVNKLAGVIYDENVRLGNHIERVLNIAKIEKENIKLEHSPQQVNDLISAVVDSMELQLHKKGTTVTLNLNAQNSVILGDELHLSNVIFNLIDNANKYSPESSKIDISTLNDGNSLLIKIKDTGIGMSKEQLKKIFEQFYRIPTGNLHDVKGFGLGLSYVNSVVKKMKGSISVKSEKDKGSEFELKFPLA
ncbi:two-component sensor histidine kinase [Pelobium manganitolerans]|uniref:histidine kinase n=1 Tax=Pelobium manganitolerans TaxID=1842495 RepID=A0A419S7H7_9SPHI|nr:HAMP domain-containing sensor histidine kinase [Pelobium manganitolerans]RKD17116.1 two-component sensor histidine kinase [Pelobium manganitolerans]